MDYGRIYGELIAARRPMPPSGYLEVHHIVPRFEGGSNDPKNLIRLSARDHIFAHLLLAKWKGGKHWVALYRTFGNITRRGIPTAQQIRIAALAKEKALKGNTFGSGRRTAATRARISAARKGMKFSKETRAKISQARTGRFPSSQTRARMSRSRIGKSPSAETRAKMSKSFTGRRHTPEAKLKMSEAAKTREAKRKEVNV